MKVLITILDDNDNVVEKDRPISPFKSITRIEREDNSKKRIDKYEFRVTYPITEPLEGGENE